MLDESAKKIVDHISRHIAHNDGEIQRAHDYPIDSMPVNVHEIAHYRNGCLNSLRDHNETLRAVRRLLIAGGDEVVTLWCEVYDKEDDEVGRDPGSPD